MNPYTLSITASSLGLGTVITLSSHHWMLAWIGLEINTLAIIPLMTQNPHPRAIEATTKYFLTQATASALILFSATMNAWLTGQWVIGTSSTTTSTFLSLAIAMKLGLAPFHFWLPEVLQGITMPTGLILSTWQKLAPTALFLQLHTSTNLYVMLFMGTLSMLIGGWGGINQTQIRKILAYSSITHLGWTVLILKLFPQLALMNFILYVIMTTTLFLTFIHLGTKNIFELSTAWTKAPTLTPLAMLTLLSVSGLPPFTGFLSKWLIAQEMIKQNLISLALLALLSTLLSLFFYLRLTYTMTLTMAPSLSFFLPPQLPTKTNLSAPLISLTLFLLPITPLIPTLM